MVKSHLNYLMQTVTPYQSSKIDWTFSIQNVRTVARGASPQDEGKRKGIASRLKGTASPHNKRIELTARGRHGLCLRKARAGDAPGFRFPAEALRPCSQLIRALYGRGCLHKMKRKNDPAIFI